jgi:hypothetical protein
MKAAQRREVPSLRIEITKKARPRRTGQNSESAMKQYTKPHPISKRKSPKISPVNSQREPLSVYDGQRLLGTCLEDEKSGLVLAWDAERRLIGRFGNVRAAADAISKAALAVEEREAQTAKALDWLNRPIVEFASGMPEHFRRGRP